MEFEWLEFETRMRKLVVDLIQPTITKMNEDRINLDKLKNLTQTQLTRVDELEAIVMNKDKRHTHFDDIYHKINEIVLYFV